VPLDAVQNAVGEERESQALLATGYMERLIKILAASRQNCEQIASCPIRLSHSSSDSYDEGRLERNF
jgi:hypothetical protein